MLTRHCIQIYTQEEKWQKTVNSDMPQCKTQCTLLRLGRVLRLTRPLAPRRWEKRDAVGMRHLCSCGTTGKNEERECKKKRDGEGERSTRKRAKVSWSFFVSVFRSQPAAVLLCFPPSFLFWLSSFLFWNPRYHSLRHKKCLPEAPRAHWEGTRRVGGANLLLS